MTLAIASRPRIDALPIWFEFTFTILLVLGALEVGYRLGRARHRRLPDEKESSVSAAAGVILGLTSFMLAFTFGIVAARHDARIALLREEAVAIRIAWQRADVLPEADRTQAKALLRESVDRYVTFVEARTSRPQDVTKFLADMQTIQNRLWAGALASTERGLDRGLATGYMNSLNDVTRLHASRVAVAIRSRVPAAIWIVLYCIATLGMASMGYQTGIAGSNRSLVWHLLAVSFALVFGLVVALDQPVSEIMKINQQPLIELRDFMSAAGSAEGQYGKP
jgi:hypothetical protein